MLGDTPVKASADVVTHRETLTISGVAVSTTVSTQWWVLGHPRQMIWANQTDAGADATLTVEFAIRDSSTGTPEWLTFQVINLTAGGSTPVVTQLTTGAAWLRFTLTGTTGQSCELAASAFV